MRPAYSTVVAMCLAIVVCASGNVLAQPLKTAVYVSSLNSPVGFVQDPSNPSIQYVVEQGGRIRVVLNGALRATDFLNLGGVVKAGGEEGLLGLAFPPDYGSSGRFYVNFTNSAGNIVIARFKRSAADSLVADASSRFDLRWMSRGTTFIEHPSFANHNGGNLVFGPDGYLYIGLGDGGSGNDPNHRAQNPNEYLGKMLRIDVGVAENNPAGYAIPPSNPFVNAAGVLPEIWSFGLRNPWRYSFDSPSLGGTGALIIADVGQGAREEIDYEPAGRGGRNYGWRNFEGTQSNVTSLPPAYQPLTSPIYDYTHAVGQSITGGYVYRGNILGANYRGRYFFADYSTRRVWSIGLTLNGAGEANSQAPIEHTADMGPVPLGNISAFGEDAAGELYIVSYSTGTVIRIIGNQTPPTTPANLRIIR